MYFTDNLSCDRLNKNFFAQPTLKVAKELLGKYIVCTRNDHLQIGQIMETEAYIGIKDQASHARFGKTKRNSVMWGSPGRIYVYLIYGIHHLVNIITEPENSPAAVLLRSVKIIDSNKINVSQIDFLKASNTSALTSQKKSIKTQNLNISKSSFFKTSKKKISESQFCFLQAFNAPALTSQKKLNKTCDKSILSPAKITRYFGLTTADTGLDLTTSNELFIVDLGDKPKKIITKPRIGINYAGPIWSKKPWRFIARV